MKLSSMDSLLLKGTAIRHQMKKAEKAFKELFIDPAREYLRSQPDNRRTILGLARPLLRINKPKTVINEELVLADIKSLVKSGGITTNELGEMLMEGTLSVGDLPRATVILSGKLKIGTGRYEKLSVTKQDSVQWDGAYKGAAEILCDEFKRLHDIEDIVRGAPRRILKDDVIKALEKRTEFVG